jgi:replicative DNA helicase
MLGYLLEYEEEQVEYIPRLHPDDFNHYRDLYRKAEKLYESEDEKLDTVNLYKRVEGNNIQDIIRSAPEPSKIESIFNSLKDVSQKRKLGRLQAKIEQIRQDDEPVKERIGELEDDLLRISEDLFETDSLQHVEDMIEGLIDHLDELHKNEGLIGIPSGLTDLDNETNGWEPGEMVILGARPAVGKTDAMIQWMLTSAGEGYQTAVFSLEMQKRSILKRVLSQMTGIERQRIRRGNYSASENQKMMKKISQLREMPLRVDDRSNTIDEISYKLHKLVRQGKCDIAMIDYVGQIDPPHIEGSNMQNRMREVSRQLADLRKRLDIPIIVLSQLNRGMLGRESKRPRKGDLRNTGGLEQDADTVILLHRPAVYDKEEDDLSKTTFILDKQRHGPQVDVRANYNTQIGKFSDVRY